MCVCVCTYIIHAIIIFEIPVGDIFNMLKKFHFQSNNNQNHDERFKTLKKASEKRKEKNKDKN